MLWGCCVEASRTGNISQVDLRLDSSKDHKILGANVTQSVKKLKLKRGWFLQQDNDLEDTTKSTMYYFMKCKRKLLEWSLIVP